MVAVMYPANLAFTPVYLNAMAGMEMEAAKGMVKSLMPFILLFNLVKAGINGVVTYIVYKRIHKLFNKLNLA